MWEEFEDVADAAESSVCDQCWDPLCPGCGPSVSSQLVKWVATALGILVVAVVVLGGIRNLIDEGSSRQDAGTPEEPPPAPSPTASSLPPPVIGPMGNPTQDVIKSVVQVAVFAGGRMCGWGSGTVLDDPLTVVTNEHVIASSEDCMVSEIQIWTVDSLDERPRPTYRASVRSRSVDADLATLALVPMTTESPVLVPVPRSAEAKVGEDVFIIGFPSIGGSTITVSKGVISGFSSAAGVTWLKTDASISGGNSGGAAVNANGLMIGVPTMASAGEDGEVVDCRPVVDTNRDGSLDEYDECKPIGGFLNLLSPMVEVEKLLAMSSGDQPPEAVSVDPPTDQARRMLNAVNEEREARGLRSLVWCTNLADAAKAHAVDMARRDYFEHDSPEGMSPSDRARVSGYGSGAGENIAAGYPSVTSVMNGWMRSPGHKANILDGSYRHFGYGVAEGSLDGSSALYWVQNFGIDGTC